MIASLNYVVQNWEALGNQFLRTFKSQQFLLAAIKGLRNGLVYGARIRAPHALVMVFLFGDGTFYQKLLTIFRLTKTHATNLAKFVFSYKLLRGLLIKLNGGIEQEWHSFFAAVIMGYYVFGENNAVNMQINLYLLSRVVVGLAKLGVDQQVVPQPNFPVFPVFAALVWGLVLWMFEHHQDVLQGSLQKSMTYLYHDSNFWTNIRTFLLKNKTPFFVGNVWGVQYMKMLTVQFAYVQYFMTFLMAANRFTMVWSPVHHNNIWKKYYGLILFLVLFCPTPITIPFLFRDVNFTYSLSADCFFITASTTWQTIVLTAFMVFCSSFAAAHNIIAVMKIRRVSNTASNSTKAEQNLIFHGIINCLIETFSTVLVLGIYFGPSPLNVYCQKCLSYCSDALSFASPFVLLFCSGKLRDALMFWRKNTKVLFVQGRTSTVAGGAVSQSRSTANMAIHCI